MHVGGGGGIAHRDEFFLAVVVSAMGDKLFHVQRASELSPGYCSLCSFLYIRSIFYYFVLCTRCAYFVPEDEFSKALLLELRHVAVP